MFFCYLVFYYKQLVHSSTCLLVYSSTNLCSSVTLSFITSNSSTHQPVYLSTYITLSFIKSTLSTRPLTCVLLLPCLLLQATRSLVHLVHSSTNLVFYYKQLIHSSNSFTRPLTLSFITSNSSTRLTCLLPSIQATRSLVHLVHLSTYITTYIFLGIGFLVLYLCIVIRNEGMTN